MNKEDTKMKNFIDEARTNILEDRAATKTLLMGLLKYMQGSEDRHKEVGLVAAKYLETLQRSNEQLVKLAALKQKRETIKEEISDKDKEELFDLISSSSSEKEDE